MEATAAPASQDKPLAVVPKRLTRLTLPVPPHERPAGPRPLAEIEADLSRPLEPAILHTKPKAGTNMIFIEWHTVKRLLDAYAPGWQARQVFTTTAQGRIICAMEIGIPTSDQGMVWRPNVGDDQDESDDQDLNPETGELLPVGYTWHKKEKRVIRRPEQIPPSMNAWASAFKRTAASHVGLGLYLYYLTKTQREQLERLIPDENKGRGY